MIILVTGSNGFIGQSLVKTLKELGYQVEEFDVGPGRYFYPSVQLEHLDHVFHLASRTFVPASWDRPFDFYQTNVMGTVNVLETCKLHKCALTYVSSYVYGAPNYLPVDEAHPINPASPYNHSKLVAEDVCKYYSQTFNFPISVLRPVNIYGPYQRSEFLIPTIIQQVLDKSIETIELQNLRPKRDYLFIDDFIAALIATLNNKSFEIFNLGSGYSISVEEIIKMILHESGISKPYMSKNIDRVNEVWDVYADISKIKQHLNWQPKTSFSKGIALCLAATEPK